MPDTDTPTPRAFVACPSPVQMQILLILQEHGTGMTGKDIQDASGGKISRGTVYTTINRMPVGLVVKVEVPSKWSWHPPSPGVALSPAGKKAAKALLRYQDAIDEARNPPAPKPKKAPAKKTTSKKAPAKKTPAKKATSKKPAAKKAPARRAKRKAPASQKAARSK